MSLKVYPTNILLSLLLAITSGCTTNNKIYTFDDNEKFSTVNTVLLPVAVVGITAIVAGKIVYEVAKSEAGISSSNSYVSCNGSYCSNPAAWDFLPGSNQYRCRITRGLNGGQFTENYHCNNQVKVDNWY